MARIRSIKPEIRRSLTVSAWPYPVRWTFVGLPGYCDDAGRAIDDARLVKAELYPLDDDMTSKKIDSHLRTIAQTGPLCRYEVGGVRYLHLISWGEHQKINRPTPSRIPPCPDHEDGVKTPGGLTEDAVSPHAEDEPAGSEGSLLTCGRVPAEQGAGSGAGSRDSSGEGAAKPPRRLAAVSEDNASAVVAAYFEAATKSGRPRPTEAQRGKIGKAAKRQLAEGIPMDEILAAARDCGTSGFSDLDTARQKPNRRAVSPAQVSRSAEDYENERGIFGAGA